MEIREQRAARTAGVGGLMEQWEADLARIIWEQRKFPHTCAVDVVEAVKALRAQWLHEWREEMRGRHLREVKR